MLPSILQDTYLARLKIIPDFLDEREKVKIMTKKIDDCVRKNWLDPLVRGRKEILATSFRPESSSAKAGAEHK